MGFAHSINNGVDLLLVDDEIHEINSSYGLVIVISLLFIWYFIPHQGFINILMPIVLNHPYII